MTVVLCDDCGCGCEVGKRLEEEEEIQMGDDVVEGVQSGLTVAARNPSQ